MISKIYKQFCNLYSIAPYCLDANGQKNDLPPEMQKRFLAAFDINVATRDDISCSLTELIRQYWQTAVKHSLVFPENAEFLVVELRLPTEVLRHPICWRITEETGEWHEGELNLAQKKVTVTEEVEGIQYVALEAVIPVSLPCGYHALSFHSEALSRLEFEQTCTMIITPETCYTPPGLLHNNRLWGIACQLETIRSGRNWGIGDFADLRNLMTWSSRHGAGTVAINPLQARTLPIEASAFSTHYKSTSFLDPLYLAPEEMADFNESHEAKKYSHEAAVKVRLASLREQSAVDFQEVALTKKSIYEICWNHFRENHLEPDSGRGLEFRQFLEKSGEVLRAYCIFEALQQYFIDNGESSDWRTWPQNFRQYASPALADFIEEHKERIEFYQYLQWQARLQLTALGRRSMELGLKVGLCQRLADGVAQNSFETWYYSDLYPQGLKNEYLPDLHTPSLFFPKLALAGYEPFITMLQANMGCAGALIIPSHLLAEEQCYFLKDRAAPKIYFKRPVADLLGIIALESKRNRCKMIFLHGQELTHNFRARLVGMSVLPYRPGYFDRDQDGFWFSPEKYADQTIVATSDDRSTSLNGFWLGKDLELQGTVSSLSRRERQIIDRAAERAKLLVALHRQDLLPDEYDVDPATVSWLSPELMQAVHLFLVQTTSKIFLLPLQDLPCLQELNLVEEFLENPIPLSKLGLDLETLEEQEQLQSLFRTFCLERGMGVIKPSALLTDRRAGKTASIPRSFYRLQLNHRFTFRHATEIVPYLSELGISHCYCSPCLMARPHSPHGYDIIDHSTLNPELGSREDFENFVAALERHQMAQIIDVVPNHMGVGSDNKWWMDVLENGQSSCYADFFDINWQPQDLEMQGCVLLPVLGDHYGTVLEDGQLQLDFKQEEGTFVIRYYEYFFPVAPQTYPFILGHDLKRLEQQLGGSHNGLLELQTLLSSFANLPDRRTTEAEQKKTRQRNKEVLKRLLARLCRETPEIVTFVRENVILFNGEKGRPESFDLLHELLGQQSYRLAFWRVAADEINYRRFFDINDLAGIRMENQAVFDETHSLVLDLVATGKVDGLRIDHPDGLYAPKRYFSKLQEAVSDESSARGKPLYVVVEKILADFEHLPTDWQVHGTTGYDFGVIVNGIFVDQDAEQEFTQIYHRFIGGTIDFEDLLYRCKKLIIQGSMAGELNVLAGQLNRLAKMSRRTQDFTLNRLRDVLVETIAHFPVYRTYLTPDSIGRYDRNYIEWAIAGARADKLAEDVSIYGFLQKVLLLELEKEQSRDLYDAARDFVMKFQQYTGPVMAKGMEDTSFYIANRLLSLNEVGGEPRRFGVSLAAFHHGNRERANYYPHGMLNTSTHDSKRSGDVRARINVLSEMAGEWQTVLATWRKYNKKHRTNIGGSYAPSRNDEYALYQNLIGVWPFTEMNDEHMASFTGRIGEYMLKVLREAKVHTSWINQDPDYEEAVLSFIIGILGENSPFLENFLSFQQKVAWFGIFNSLAQLLLKLTSPGIPDTYQGSELWHFCLVDPDNRKPVDFEQCQTTLSALQELMNVPSAERSLCIRQLLDNMTDGRVKLYTLWKTLQCRREHSELFERGAYLPLAVEGEKEAHICSFMRHFGEQRLVVAVPRLTAGLLDKDESRLPLGREVWLDTRIILPDNLRPQIYKNVFTGELIFVDTADKMSLEGAVCFNSYPVCLLLQTSDRGKQHE